MYKNLKNKSSFTFLGIGLLLLLCLSPNLYAQTKGVTTSILKTEENTLTFNSPTDAKVMPVSGAGQTTVAFADATGAPDEVQPIPPSVPPPPYSGTNTYKITRGAITQVWSEAVRMPDCNKDDFINTPDVPACRNYHDGKGNIYYYYNWAYVNTNKENMCPDPWRVPTESDFRDLRLCLGSATIEGVYYPENTPWSGIPAGFADKGNVTEVGKAGYYWSVSNSGAFAAYSLIINKAIAYIQPKPLDLGKAVRCVR